MYPAYSPETRRYGVHPAPDGSVVVQVSGASAVWFDGVPDVDGTAVFTGLTSGEEISVFVDSASIRRQYALYVLPDGFPNLSGTVTGAVAPGHVALTLDRFDGGPAPRFEAIIDRQGVPIYTRRSTDDSPLDLKQSPQRHADRHRRSTTPGKTGTALVESR